MNQIPKEKRPVVISLEQALSMSYATLRFVHMGWRVIRIEPTPIPGRKTKGDPNRYIGRPIAGEDRHSYCVAPNVGKEALALDLKTPKGKEILYKLIKELDVDIFCTNNLPRHHNTLGIDYNRLREIKEDLIWCSISAQGLDYPDVPGYDPMIQAMCGFMDLTGDSDGPPMQCGPPIIDLKAGDEAFTQVIIAMMEREKTKSGKMIDISMAQIAASWLHTFLPMLDMDSPPSELKRSGNEHRQFIPVNAYPTQDGFIYVAIGSDGQWARIVKHPAFLSLDMEKYTTNESRRQNKKQLHNDIGAITQKYSTSDIAKILTEAVIPHSPITPIEKVMELPFIKKELLKTETPDGKTVRLPPPAVNTPYLEKVKGNIPFTPAYGEQSISLLEEAGVPSNEIPSLLEKGVIA